MPKRGTKSATVPVEQHEEVIRIMSAQMGNLEVQIADYRQIVKELSNKLKLYEKKYGVVFKNSTK